METTIEILWHVGLGLCLLAGWLLAVFQLPGTWFILAATAVYDWHFEWGSITWQILVVMALLAALLSRQTKKDRSTFSFNIQDL